MAKPKPGNTAAARNNKAAWRIQLPEKYSLPSGRISDGRILPALYAFGILSSAIACLFGIVNNISPGTDEIKYRGVATLLNAGIYYNVCVAAWHPDQTYGYECDVSDITSVK